MKMYQLACVGLVLVAAATAQSDNLNDALYNANANNLDANSPFWWMSKGSPFKRAIQTGPQLAQQEFNFESNPFFSGRPFGVADSEPAAADNIYKRQTFRGPGYLPPDNTPRTEPCLGGNRVCVPRYQCVGGSIDANQVRGSGSQVNYNSIIFISN